jgi:histidine triad (HIT) family protein
VRTFRELPADLVGTFAATAQRLEVAVETGLDVPGSMVLVNNVVSQSVPHLHLHVIPRRPKDGLRFWLGPRHPYTDDDPPEGYARRIRSVLSSDL